MRPMTIQARNHTCAHRQFSHIPLQLSTNETLYLERRAVEFPWRGRSDNFIPTPRSIVLLGNVGGNFAFALLRTTDCLAERCNHPSPFSSKSERSGLGLPSGTAGLRVLPSDVLRRYSLP